MCNYSIMQLTELTDKTNVSLLIYDQFGVKKEVMWNMVKTH